MRDFPGWPRGGAENLQFMRHPRPGFSGCFALAATARRTPHSGSGATLRVSELHVFSLHRERSSGSVLRAREEIAQSEHRVPSTRGVARE